MLRDIVIMLVITVVVMSLLVVTAKYQRENDPQLSAAANAVELALSDIRTGQETQSVSAVAVNASAPAPTSFSAGLDCQPAETHQDFVQLFVSTLDASESEAVKMADSSALNHDVIHAQLSDNKIRDNSVHNDPVRNDPVRDDPVSNNQVRDNGALISSFEAYNKTQAAPVSQRWLQNHDVSAEPITARDPMIRGAILMD